ncbi:hypothetical protein GWC95_02185 [Sediminibacterium roseum]|uniref:TonB protein C-terminal n=1 Tax=Sediminibacterium roseum TaxID=1978412 RepID=A0ABW9ZNQ9_9BACT|nr:hypothetical protein [Sediminibacterium roseum]NCI48716.1 hypothetical protein [Sediminibacterium roseum]
MNFCKTILLFVAFLLFSINTIGQQKLLENRNAIYSSLNAYVYTAGKEILARECEDGCFFIRFNVDANGFISNIQSNRGAWQALDTIVQSALRTTSGRWKGTKSNKPFVLPVLFNSGDCAPIGPNTPVTEILARIPKITDSTDMIKSMQKSMHYNFLHMNDFDHSEKSSPFTPGEPIECILLTPLYFTGPKIKV